MKKDSVSPRNGPSLRLGLKFSLSHMSNMNMLTSGNKSEQGGVRVEVARLRIDSQVTQKQLQGITHLACARGFDEPQTKRVSRTTAPQLDSNSTTTKIDLQRNCDVNWRERGRGRWVSQEIRGEAKFDAPRKGGLC
jgi:hypothetical protein